MSCGLERNLEKVCKNSIGGVNKVYLFTFVKYSRSQITLNKQELVTFPTTTIYDWDSIATNFSETTSVEGGDIAWGQSFSIQIPKTVVTSEVFKLAKSEWRAIIIDRLGNIRILGLFNGLDAEISIETGQSKSDFNGYKVTFTGKEDNQSYFISNLNGAGFTIKQISMYLFQNDNEYLLQNDNDYIFN